MKFRITCVFMVLIAGVSSCANNSNCSSTINNAIGTYNVQNDGCTFTSGTPCTELVDYSLQIEKDNDCEHLLLKRVGGSGVNLNVRVKYTGSAGSTATFAVQDQSFTIGGSTYAVNAGSSMTISGISLSLVLMLANTQEDAIIYVTGYKL
jgi:hypothetical protein